MKQRGVAHVPEFGGTKAVLPGSRPLASSGGEPFVCSQCRHGKHSSCASLRCVCPRCAPTTPGIDLRR